MTMSEATFEVIADVKRRIAEQEERLKQARDKGNSADIEREENILHSIQRRLEQLEREARMGH